MPIKVEEKELEISVPEWRLRQIYIALLDVLDRLPNGVLGISDCIKFMEDEYDFARRINDLRGFIHRKRLMSNTIINESKED